VHNHLRTHGNEGVTEPSRDGPGPVGPGGIAQPTPVVGSAPFPCTRRIFNPKSLEAPPSRRGEPFTPGGHPQARERGGGSPQGDQPPRRKHPLVEKKEDTVGRETMSNGAMSSTFMG
jgi:hypothetical protein